MTHMNIKELIPQRFPILMVDELVEVAQDQATARLQLTQDNFFMDEVGLLSEAGLIEHMAQSASAMVGYEHKLAGGTRPPVGYIAEVKRFECLKRPASGQTILTTVTRNLQVGDVTIITTQCTDQDGELLARTQMKIFIDPKQ